jgi:predicted RNase H-like HicB family nuclease
MKVCVIYERSATGWGAYAPGLPGVAVVGRNIDDVRSSMMKAIELHVRDMSESELAQCDTPGEFAELLDVGSAVSEAAHRALLARAGIAM